MPNNFVGSFVGNFVDPPSRGRFGEARKAPDKVPDEEGKGFSMPELGGSAPKEGIEQKIAKFAKTEDRVPLR